ncbi:MAG: hypothetical protein PHV30_10835 [Candidatus Margulisbacteria bacterium]|nr:hypothetical protein [Candidatus Margulisiibacteriota bacterium]
MSRIYSKILSVNIPVKDSTENDILFGRYFLYIMNVLKNKEKLAIERNLSILNIMAKHKIIVLATKRGYNEKRNKLYLEMTQSAKNLQNIKNNIEDVKKIKKELETISESLFYRIFGFILRCFNKYNLEKKIKCKDKRLAVLRKERDKAQPKADKANKEWTKFGDFQELKNNQITLSASDNTTTYYYRVTSLGQKTCKILRHRTSLPDYFEALDLLEKINEKSLKRYTSFDDGEVSYLEYSEMENYLKSLVAQP